MTKSLQETYAPNNACFGCGPANEKGLRIRSFKGEEEGVLTAEFTPEKHHAAFPGVLNGGIIGTLLDCHANWTAVIALMQAQGLETAPCTVTAEFSVKLRRPTPTDQPLQIWAKPLKISDTIVQVEAKIIAAGKVCDTCTGTFVAVQPGHPAYHRW